MSGFIWSPFRRVNPYPQPPTQTPARSDPAPCILDPNPEAHAQCAKAELHAREMWSLHASAPLGPDELARLFKCLSAPWPLAIEQRYCIPLDLGFRVWGLGA